MSQSNRQPLIDLVKVVAAQFIFFHHAALYGPLSDAWHQSAPEVALMFARYGLLAVQVFLVVAGYLAVQTLSKRSELHPLLFISRRFERLARPLWFCLLLTLVLSWLARPWLPGEMLPEPPSSWQLLAHVFLLQSALGFDSLSAGVWYTAIDFQLYVIMVWLVLAARKSHQPWLWPAAVAVIAALSAWWFNRHAHWDASGFYFFAAYGLGALVWWARAYRWGRWLYAGVLVCVVGALWWDWRMRLFAAMATSLLLWAALDWQGLGPRSTALVARLNASTYLFFLLNFPLLIVANLLWWWLPEWSSLTPAVFVSGNCLFLVFWADRAHHRWHWLSSFYKQKISIN